MAIYIDNIVGKDILSKSVEWRLHNYVNIAKSFMRSVQQAKGRNVFHCTFCIEHGKVKEVGFNSYKHIIDWHPFLGKVKLYSDKAYNMCKHAEVDAVLRLRNTNLSKMVFFNVHIDKNFHCRNSKPCSNCLELMSRAGVRKVVYFDEMANKFLLLKIH